MKYELELFQLGGEFFLFEEERPVGVVEADCAAVDLSYGKLILFCWGEGWSRSWRVTGCHASPHRLMLRCVKKGGQVACLVELRRGDVEVQLSREEFSRKLPSLIESNLPGLSVEKAITARDDRLHLSGAHTRLVIREKGRVMAAIGSGESELQSNIDALLGAGIVWLDALGGQGSHISRLMIFAPRDRAMTLAARLTAVRPAGAAVSLYEVEETSGLVTAVEPFDQGDLIDNYRRFAGRAIWPHAVGVKPGAGDLIDSIVQLAPGAVETRRRGGSVSFSLRGLEFARVSISSERAWFGVFEKKRLEANNFDELAGLAAMIASRRCAEAVDRNDRLYRAQPERWLESIIRQDVTAIDPTLDTRWVYSQVPAYRGEQRAYIDLLAANCDGRLVVIEIKVSEDAEFPLQGLDYWLRVEWHRRRGDFERRGYFKGMKIQDRPPLLYLVAPLFSFHRTTALIASSIIEQVQVLRIGINEDWRAGVRPLLREWLNKKKRGTLRMPRPF
jgi:hypothetical protein